MTESILKSSLPDAMKSVKIDEDCSKHEVRYECDTCDKTFSSRSNFYRHHRTHSSEKAFSCDLCQKSFSRKDALKTHMDCHNGKKLFSCVLCHKSFRTKYSLFYHINSHLQPKKSYECEICLKSFNRTRSLKSHMRAHSGQNKVSVKDSNNTFNEGNLNQSKDSFNIEDESFKQKFEMNKDVISASRASDKNVIDINSISPTSYDFNANTDKSQDKNNNKERFVENEQQNEDLMLLENSILETCIKCKDSDNSKKSKQETRKEGKVLLKNSVIEKNLSENEILLTNSVLFSPESESGDIDFDCEKLLTPNVITSECPIFGDTFETSTSSNKIPSDDNENDFYYTIETHEVPCDENGQPTKEFFCQINEEDEKIYLHFNEENAVNTYVVFTRNHDVLFLDEKSNMEYLHRV
eukprot:TRINITY_DN1733_c0_g1_i12.p1 TRINITY_DN1733_c0_g1~~TRINITY_DN1733_c0_g1_i12.p1  ORF type:complete len:410 (-),score=58.49 TRINITY_DN1733_c0_g1_i12:169-1398(-)